MKEEGKKRVGKRKYNTMQYNKIPILALLAREILPIHLTGINSQESNGAWFRKLQPGSLSHSGQTGSD